MIIGICGYAGAGKSTLASILERDHGMVRRRFAGPLKRMMAAAGLTPDEIDGDLKEAPCDRLCGRSPRHAMQTLGTEWGRQLIGDDLWVRLWLHEVSRTPCGVVADDCRFVNEAAAIRGLGGIIVRVDRPGLGRRSDHVSEAIPFAPDEIIENGGSISDLEKAAQALMATTGERG